MLTLSSALLLTACGNDADEPTEDAAEDITEEVEDAADETTDKATGEELQDGTYRLEELNFGGTGWKEALEIVVEGGEIVDATWESVNEEGMNKIEDEGYQERMTETDGLGPQDFIPALEEALVEAQNPADVEVVSGATGTSEKFKEYAEQLVEAAKEGNTDVIEIDNEG